MVRLYTFILSFLLILGSAQAFNVPVPFKLYPNPLTGDILQVNFDFEYKAGQVYTFVITNVIGQVVHSHVLTEEEVKRGSLTIRVDDIRLDKGVYLTKMIIGDQSSVQKLVVR